VKRPFFRREVYEHEYEQRAGRPLAISPLSFKLFAGFVAAVLVAIGCLLYWGRYTNERAVPGYLLPSEGLVTIKSPQRGTIIARYVHLGDHVRKGQKLYEIALQRSTAETANVNAALVKQYNSELQGVRSRIALAKQLQTSKVAQLQGEQRNLKAEYRSLGTQLQTEQAILALAKKNLARYQKLVRAGMVSKTNFQKIQQKMLSQQAAVEEIGKDRIELRTQLDQIPAQFAQAKTNCRK
jgi:membrane fusion protein